MSTARPLPQELLVMLADGELHSGEHLAGQLGVSRSAIWKAASQLRALGVELHAVPQRGYRLQQSIAPLDTTRILSGLAESQRARLRAGSVHWRIASTNAALLENAPLQPGSFDFCVAEYQSAGRGRRGRSWLAPPGGAVCLSLKWAFDALPPEPGTLSLAMGVCVLRALRRFGQDEARLKWPNDVLARGSKLAGILIELRAESNGLAQLVIGIGMNLQLGSALQQRVAGTGTTAISLHGLGFDLTRRNELVAALISECIAGLDTFEREGFAPFATPWRAADALCGAVVTVSDAQGATQGVARGIDAAGALLVETPGALRRFRSGDVSVRAA